MDGQHEARGPETNVFGEIDCFHFTPPVSEIYHFDTRTHHGNLDTVIAVEQPRGRPARGRRRLHGVSNWKGSSVRAAMNGRSPVATPTR